MFSHVQSRSVAISRFTLNRPLYSLYERGLDGLPGELRNLSYGVSAEFETRDILRIGIVTTYDDTRGRACRLVRFRLHNCVSGNDAGKTRYEYM